MQGDSSRVEAAQADSGWADILAFFKKELGR
jgi:hypothetical protein